MQIYQTVQIPVRLKVRNRCFKGLLPTRFGNQDCLVSVGGWSCRDGSKNRSENTILILNFIIELVTFNCSRSQFFAKEAPQIIPGPFSSLLPPTHILSKHFLIHIQHKNPTLFCWVLVLESNWPRNQTMLMVEQCS